jgi:hypothetical protein
MADDLLIDAESVEVEAAPKKTARKSKEVSTLRKDAPVAASTQPSDTTALMTLIERAARDPDMDLDRMERLIAMHEKMESKHAEADFNAAMAAAQAEIGPVVAKKSNNQTNSKYADLAAIVAVAQPIIAKHGLSTSFGTEASDVPNHYRVTCEVSRGGFSKTYRADIPMDNVGMKGNANKTATHAFGSTMTYGRRYLFCMIFNIAIADDDGQSAGAKHAERLTEKQVDEMFDLLAETSADVDKFLAIGSLEPLGEDRSPDAIKSRLANIYANQFSAAMTKIRKAHEARKKQKEDAQ